jgi:hypothetical protein
MTEFAFPNSHLSHIKGMTLRDYFAAAVLPLAIKEMNEAESYDSNDAAIVAYQYADAMMKARQSND